MSDMYVIPHQHCKCAPQFASIISRYSLIQHPNNLVLTPRDNAHSLWELPVRRQTASFVEVATSLKTSLNLKHVIMSAEELAWNEYTEQYGHAPTKTEHLIKFARKQSHLHNLSFKTAKEFFILQKTKSPQSTDTGDTPQSAASDLPIKLSIQSSIPSISLPPLNRNSSSSHRSRPRTPSLIQSVTSIEDQPSDSTDDDTGNDLKFSYPDTPSNPDPDAVIDTADTLSPDVVSSHHTRTHSKIEELLKEQEMLELQQNDGINGTLNIFGDDDDCDDNDDCKDPDDPDGDDANNLNIDSYGDSDADSKEDSADDPSAALKDTNDEQDEAMMERILIDCTYFIYILHQFTP